MYKIGDEIEFIHYGRMSMLRVKATIHEVKESSVLCRRAKGKGKVIYEVPFEEILGDGRPDPIKKFVSLMRQVHHG